VIRTGVSRAEREHLTHPAHIAAPIATPIQGGSPSLVAVSPQQRGIVSPEHVNRIVKATATLELAEIALRAAVVEALQAGSSVREVAAVADLSTNTVQRWKADAGIVSPSRAAVMPKNWPPGL
jgi:hypothetical protein